MNTTTITKPELEALFGFSISDEMFESAFYCSVDEEWTVLGEDGYPFCACN